MGIQGFTSFVDSNLHLIDAYKLCKTKIIIDGNNLYHLLYYDHSTDYKHGGDYDQFSRKAHKFFDMLKACEVSPFVVFDGGYNIDDSKLNTSLSRANRRIVTTSHIGQGNSGRIMPLLAYSTFLHVLVDLEIPHCCCDFEADDQIAVLSHEWNCPVLSYDSDFYIYNTRGGFVPFDGLQLRVCNEEDDPKSKYLPATIYYSENFYQHYPKLGASVMPLLATLLGNDYVNQGTFENFYLQIKKPKHALPSVFQVPTSNTRLAALLHWFHGVDSVHDAIQRVLSSMKSENRQKVMASIEMSMNMYERQEFSTVNLKNLLESPDDVETQMSQTSVNGDIVMPAWFQKAYWKGQIFPFCQNTLILQRNINLCQVENISQASSYDCSINIRRVIYGILQSVYTDSVDPAEISDLSEQLQEDAITVDNEGKESGNCIKRKSEGVTYITEYNRDQKNIRKCYVEPLCKLPGFSRLPSLNSIDKICLADRKKLLLTALDAIDSKILEFSEQHQLVMASIVYWINHSNPKVTINQVKVMLLCVVAMTIKRLVKTPLGDDDEEIRKAFTESAVKDIENANEHFKKFFSLLEHNKKHPINVVYIHNFSQLQTCYLAAMTLNQILQFPFKSLDPGKFFNGTFLYHMNRELDFRANVDIYISELLVRHSPCHEVYLHFLSRVMYNIAADKLQGLSCDKFKVRKRQRTRKSDKRSQTAEHHSDTEEGDNEDTRYHTNCDVSNRYGALCTGE